MTGDPPRTWHPPPLRPIERWFVCESSTRWVHALRRFVPAMVAQGSTLQIKSVDPSEVLAAVRSGDPSDSFRSVLFWEVSPDSFAQRCSVIVQAARAAPAVLQLASAVGIGSVDRSTLSELGISVAIRHPEELPLLEPLIRGHFARSGERLN